MTAGRPDYDGSEVRRRLARTALAYGAHALMFPFGFLPSRHAPKRARDLRTVVFVHGFQANRASLFPVQAWLRMAGHTRQLSYNYASTVSIESMAIRLKHHLDANIKGGRIDIVAHSMGGLVARVYLQMLGGHRRVDRLITLGTPHHGTWSGSYLPTRLGSQFHPDGPFIRRLNALPPPPGVKVHCLVGGQDGIILPPTSARSPWPARAGHPDAAETLVFEDLGHLDLALAPASLKAIAARLA